jgi:hypothetical protein
MSYLFLLLAICCIPPTLSLRKDMIKSLETNQVELINQLPDIRIKNGLVRVDQTEPLHLKSRGKTVAIIDTTGSMNYIEDDDVKVLLTTSSLIFRRGENQFNTLNLSQVSDFHINRDIAQRWIEMTRNSLAPLSYGIFLLLSYIFTVLLMLLVAIVGLILSAILHSSLKFAAVLRLAAAAATPSIILVAASVAIGQPIPGLVYIGITLTYLIVGILACSKPGVEEEVPRLKLSGLLDEGTENHHSHAA